MAILDIKDESLNLVAPRTEIEGKLVLSDFSRFNGKVKGKLIGKTEEQVILGEHSLIEGEIEAHDLVIDGYVCGEIRATKKVKISGTGRVFGNIFAPSIEIAFGGFFEGKCHYTGIWPKS